ncbi:MAG: type II toxin-antitoxin system RelE/ParE family toxin [Defluviitaleaceae bacterium]|nr:type II toxin-antitoxin system RelE/ParE family toxin [Defluviitaleaceae bacterium]
MEPHPYNYVFMPLAEQDLNDIFDYISLELASPEAAEQLIDKIQCEVERVCEFPFSRPLLTDKILHSKGYRLIVVNNFNLFYIIKNRTILIQRVLYGRRNYEALL